MSGAWEKLREFAPFLAEAGSPTVRRHKSEAFDAKLESVLGGIDTLPTIHCYYEILSNDANHDALRASVASMLAAGHTVKLWSYRPDLLQALAAPRLELCNANDVIRVEAAQRIFGQTDIRYFSDLFRYAVLYERGGLWMDTDIVLLRAFPYRGEHFLNLQWGGEQQGHGVVGNVLYARQFSRHMRALYELALQRFEAGERAFGDVGPKLLTDYVMSPEGAELRDWVFSPMLFNSVDWTEIEAFGRPIQELAEHLNSDRVYGVHLWAKLTSERTIGGEASAAAMLLRPTEHFPDFEALADACNTDKNRIIGNRHFYARVYSQLFTPMRLSTRSLMEIGLCRGRVEGWAQSEVPSIDLWRKFFPFAHIHGLDLTDFAEFNDPRFTSYVCDQSDADQLAKVATSLEPDSIDIIIDDGSHASYDQQLTFREFFKLLRPGGLFIIEDLDWQPPNEAPGVALTKRLFHDLAASGGSDLPDLFGIAEFLPEIESIRFFESQSEFAHRGELGGMVVIRKSAKTVASAKVETPANAKGRRRKMEAA